jgi:hypothetical protein
MDLYGTRDEENCYEVTQFINYIHEHRSLCTYINMYLEDNFREHFLVSNHSFSIFSSHFRIYYILIILCKKLDSTR